MPAARDDADLRADSSVGCSLEGGVSAEAAMLDDGVGVVVALDSPVVTAALASLVVTEAEDEAEAKSDAETTDIPNRNRGCCRGELGWPDHVNKLLGGNPPENEAGAGAEAGAPPENEDGADRDACVVIAGAAGDAKMDAWRERRRARGGGCWDDEVLDDVLNITVPTEVRKALCQIVPNSSSDTGDAVGVSSTRTVPKLKRVLPLLGVTNTGALRRTDDDGPGVRGAPMSIPLSRTGLGCLKVSTLCSILLFSSFSAEVCPQAHALKNLFQKYPSLTMAPWRALSPF